MKSKFHIEIWIFLLTTDERLFCTVCKAISLTNKETVAKRIISVSRNENLKFVIFESYSTLEVIEFS